MEGGQGLVLNLGGVGTLIGMSEVVELLSPLSLRLPRPASRPPCPTSESDPWHPQPGTGVQPNARGMGYISPSELRLWGDNLDRSPFFVTAVCTCAGAGAAACTNGTCSLPYL